MVCHCPSYGGCSLENRWCLVNRIVRTLDDDHDVHLIAISGGCELVRRDSYYWAIWWVLISNYNPLCDADALTRQESSLLYARWDFFLLFATFKPYLKLFLNYFIV